MNAPKARARGTLTRPLLLDDSSLPLPPLGPKVYATRWWIAFLWAWFGVVSAFGWDMYAPIAAPLTKDFGWTDDTINWLANSNNLALVVTAPAWAWLADTKGIRPAAQLASGIWLASALLNLVLIFPDFPKPWSWVPAMASEVLAGVVSPIQNFGPPLISATWFPVIPGAHSLP